MQPEKKVFTLYKSALLSIFDHRIILLPFITVAFLQLLVIEILYFYPRFPLKIVFEPFISKLWSPVYMHYPHNLSFLPKLFQDVNAFLFIFVSCYLVCVAIHLISEINQGQEASIGKSLKAMAGRYVHIAVGAFIILAMIWAGHYVYDLIAQRAMKIRSETGKFFLLKSIILNGRPYFGLFINVLVATVWAYLLPILAVDKRNIFISIANNFVVLSRSFFTAFWITFWPSLVASTILLLRTSKAATSNPDLSILILCLTLVCIVITDALIYTSLTVYYLAWKESRKEQS